MPSPAHLEAPLQAHPHANLRLQHRQHCNPKADRLPRWLHRVWAWF